MRTTRLPAFKVRAGSSTSTWLERERPQVKGVVTGGDTGNHGQSRASRAGAPDPCAVVGRSEFDRKERRE